MTFNTEMAWSPSKKSSATLRALYRARAKKPILLGLLISYMGMLFIPPEGESLFSIQAISIHAMVILMWAAAYWYFGSSKFAQQNYRLLINDPPTLIIDGWVKNSPKFEIIKEIDGQLIIDIDGYALKYAAIPKHALPILKH